MWYNAFRGDRKEALLLKMSSEGNMQFLRSYFIITSEDFKKVMTESGHFESFDKLDSARMQKYTYRQTAESARRFYRLNGCHILEVEEITRIYCNDRMD